MKKIALIVISVALLALAGCQGVRGRDVGTIAGAGTGALVGSSLAKGSTGKAVGAVGGAVVGGLVGHTVGKSMEK